MKTDDLVRRHAVIQGVLDAIVELQETRDAFDAWDAELGLSAKAKRLAIAEDNLQKVRARRDRKRLRGAQHARDEAMPTFDSAAGGPDLWDSHLLGSAGDLIRDLGVTIGDPVHSELAFRLVDQFVQAKAGRPRNDAGPDFSPSIGRRFTIPESAPTWFVRRYLLPPLIRDVKKARAAVEKVAAKPGLPADVETCRRDGRWYFLEAAKRSTRHALLSPVRGVPGGPPRRRIRGEQEHRGILPNSRRALRAPSSIRSRTRRAESECHPRVRRPGSLGPQAGDEQDPERRQ